MTIAVLFNPPALDQKQYFEIIRRLEAAGLGAPHGREYHVCFGSGDHLRVLDIWESQETLETFAATMGPIVVEVGSHPGEPQVAPLLNVIEGPRGSGTAGREENNKAVVRRLLDGVYNQHDVSVIDETVAVSFVAHDPMVRDLEGGKLFMAGVLAAFPDVRITIDQQIADGDTVATRWTVEGTQRGDFLGIPASGRRARVSGTTISRVVNGWIVEEWPSWDRADLMAQLGVLPGTEQPVGA